MAEYVGAIDQGTTSSRFIIFDRGGRIAATAQKEHEQIYPQPGWVEHQPAEIWQRTSEVVAQAMAAAGLKPRDLAAIGITNQRETTVLWNRKTGLAVNNALVWQDMRVGDGVTEMARDGGHDRFRAQTGLPLSTYFSALKIRWILDQPGDFPFPLIKLDGRFEHPAFRQTSPSCSHGTASASGLSALISTQLVWTVLSWTAKLNSDTISAKNHESGWRSCHCEIQRPQRPQCDPGRLGARHRVNL